MNRKQFLKNLSLAGAFTILPGAKTYERIWKPNKFVWVVNWRNITIGEPEYMGETTNMEWNVEFQEPHHYIKWTGNNFLKI